MSTFQRDAEISVWLERNRDKIAVVAKATGIDRTQLEAVASGTAQLTAQDKKALRDYLVKIVSTSDMDSI